MREASEGRRWLLSLGGRVVRREGVVGGMITRVGDRDGRGWWNWEGVIVGGRGIVEERIARARARGRRGLWHWEGILERINAHAEVVSWGVCVGNDGVGPVEGICRLFK